MSDEKIDRAALIEQINKVITAWQEDCESPYTGCDCGNYQVDWVGLMNELRAEIRKGLGL